VKGGSVKLNRLKRKAASKVFFFVFAMLNNLCYQLHFSHLEWDLVDRDDLFSEKEQDIIDRMIKRLHNEAELCRRIGQRLCK
jgi:hypothetical protein